MGVVELRPGKKHTERAKPTMCVKEDEWDLRNLYLQQPRRGIGVRREDGSDDESFSSCRGDHRSRRQHVVSSAPELATFRAREYIEH